MNKRAIRRSFDRAAGSYDAAAALQRQVGELLLAVLPGLTFENRGLSPISILDAGCGTGHALNLLAGRWPDARIVAADFAPAMLRTAGGGVCADIEALPFADATFDLYWSSLTFQWCDARLGLAEAARVLAPGGRLAVSSLAPGTLAELDAAFTGIDGHRHVLDFAPAQALADACIAAGLRNVAVLRKTVRHHHADLGSLLSTLRLIGANQVGDRRRQGLMGRRTWQAFEAHYESLREAAGLPVTWEVLLCTATS
ncbi:MAG: methyltransferase domain-containing protein [Rhodocyclaceae bacterium]|nr:methyltransferase domain-containing protein [Rhodocyclaceae bacterium]